jgi:hypothetical protein
VTDIVAQVPATIEALTGIDLMSALQGLPGLKATDDQAGDGEKFTKEMQEAAPAEAEQDGEETT